jgi:hypothetical protein
LGLGYLHCRLFVWQYRLGQSEFGQNHLGHDFDTRLDGHMGCLESQALTLFVRRCVVSASDSVIAKPEGLKQSTLRA